MTKLVWHVFGTMDVGGAELRTLDLADALRGRGVQFGYVTLSGRHGVLDDRIRAAGDEIHSVPLGPGFPWRLYRELRKERPAVIDSHVATFSGLLVFVAWLARVPVRIAHFRSDGDGHSPTVRRILQRAAMLLLIRIFATDIVGVSPGSLTLGYRSGWARQANAVVIPNGLPAWQSGSELPLSFERPIAVHVGRPSPEKNRAALPYILKAARANGWPGSILLAGGTGADATELAGAISDADVADGFHELGVVHRPRDLMVGADVLLLTSHREGLPGVVLEALSVGTPVISRDLPGVRYIAELIPGVTIVADEPEAWADALVAAGATSEERRKQLVAGFAAGPFTIEAAAQAHLDLYRVRA